LEIVVADTTARDGKLSKITKKFSVPLTFRMGIQKDLWGGDSENTSRLTVSVDGINPIDYTVYGGIGLEYSWRDMAFIRCGTRLFHDTAGNKEMNKNKYVNLASTGFATFRIIKN
jgi:hypothetical protein